MHALLRNGAAHPTGTEGKGLLIENCGREDDYLKASKADACLTWFLIQRDTQEPCVVWLPFPPRLSLMGTQHTGATPKARDHVHHGFALQLQAKVTQEEAPHLDAHEGVYIVQQPSGYKLFPRSSLFFDVTVLMFNIESLDCAFHLDSWDALQAWKEKGTT